jgi:DNA-binding transcriptional LysR family regulator
MASCRLAALESRLGVPLINRATRSLHLTDEGASYYESQEPQGTLRVALPAAFGNQYVAPLVPQFVARYPAVQLALSLSDRSVVCASPEYLRRHGTPSAPEDLARHNCLLASDFAATWEYKSPDGEAGSVRVSGRYVCDNWAIYAVYPHRRHLPAKTRAFDVLASSFGPEPFWGRVVKPRIKARAAV